MKKSLGILLGTTLVFITSCGSLTEDEARRKLNSEAEILALNAEGDRLIEKVSDCQVDGQIKLLNLSQDEGISDTYPQVREDAQQYYFEQVQACRE